MLPGAEACEGVDIPRLAVRAAADGDGLVGLAGGLGGGGDGLGKSGPDGGQQQHGLAQLRAAGRTPEPVVADTVESRRRNVLKAAADELHGGKRHQALLAGAGFGVAEGDGCLGAVDDVVVSDRQAVDVAPEIFDDVGGTGAARFSMDNPARTLGKDTIRQVGFWRGGAGQRSEAAAEEGGKRLDRHEEVGIGCFQPGVVGGDAAGGHQAVDVRMPDEVPPPGVQDGEDGRRGAKMPGIGGQRLDGLGGGAHEGAAECRLVPAQRLAKRLWNGEHHVEVVHRQQLAGAVGEPSGGLVAVAGRAGAAAAGMVDELEMPAVVACLQMPAHGGGTAVDDIAERPPMPGRHRFPEARQILVHVPREDVADPRHGRIRGRPSAG